MALGEARCKTTIEILVGQESQRRARPKPHPGPGQCSGCLLISGSTSGVGGFSVASVKSPVHSLASTSTRFLALFLIVGFLGGCATDDPRLQGAWRSNRDATVATTFQRDPRWTNAPPEKVQRFKDMFGRLTI